MPSTRPQPKRKLEILPSDLFNFLKIDKYPGFQVAVDTETSGLRVDQGARISTVSVSWIDWDRKWEKIVTSHQWESGIQTYRDEVLVPGEEPVAVVSFAWPFDQGVAGTGKPEDTGQEALWPDAVNLPRDEYAYLIAWLEAVGRDAGLSMANMKFDCHMFEAGVRNWPDLVVDLHEYVRWDTQNGNDLFFGWLPTTSLKGKGSAAEMLWGAAESDEKMVISKYLTKKKLPKGRWDLMPWDVIARYADQDARLTARLAVVHAAKKYALVDGVKTYKGWFRGEGHLDAAEAAHRRMELTRMLYRMERRGVPFNTETSLMWAGVIQGRAAKQAKLLPFHPATLPTAKHYWFGTGTVKGVEGHGYPPISTTPKGAPSLTADDLDKLVEQDLPGATVWKAYSKLVRVDSMWYSGWAEKAGPDGRLRTSVRQNGTASGRFSVEGIQLQAIPHDYKLGGYPELEGIPTPRELIGAGVPEGWSMWELDLANAEARVAALYAQCTRMLELIEQGKDLHGETARELFRVDPDHPEWGKKRQVSKRANFSLIFGVGWETLQHDIESQTGIHMSDHEVKVLISKWRKLYPEYGKAIDQHMAKVKARQSDRSLPGGFLEMTNGERRWFGRSEDTHKAFNQRVQGNLAQFAIDWWLGANGICERELTQEELRTGGIVLTVHDSTVLLLPDGKEYVTKLVKEWGEQLWSKRFPGVPGGVDVTEWGDHS